jgi:hypothetical protein
MRPRSQPQAVVPGVGAFGAEIDYAMLHKIYGAVTGKCDERRYSPAVCTDIDLRPVTGNPDLEKASTSYVERQTSPCGWGWAGSLG